MYQFDRISSPELELYTLTNIHSGEEFIVTMADMKQTIHSDSDIIRMLSARHPDFLLVKRERKTDFQNVEMGILL